MSILHLDANSPAPDCTDVNAVLPQSIALVTQWIAETGTSSQDNPELYAALTHFLRTTLVSSDPATQAEAFTAALQTQPLSVFFTPLLGTLDKAKLKLSKKPRVILPIFHSLLDKLFGSFFLPVSPAGSYNTSRNTKQASTTLRHEQEYAHKHGYAIDYALLGSTSASRQQAHSAYEQAVAWIKTPGVQEISLTPTVLVPRLNPWDFQGSVRRVSQRLAEIFRQAQQHSNPQITLEIDSYQNFGLILSAFISVLSQEEFHTLQTGITIPAYFPDSFAAVKLLGNFATQRTSTGGAAITVTLTHGGNSASEIRTAHNNGWTPAIYSDSAQSHANLLRLLDWCLHSELATSMHTRLRTTNLFDAALAITLANTRGVTATTHLEVPRGVLNTYTDVLSQTLKEYSMPALSIFSPVIPSAFSYSGTDGSNYLDYILPLLQNEFLLPAAMQQPHDQQQEFVTALESRWTTPAGTVRTHIRSQSAPLPHGITFTEPTDPSLPQNREWALQWLANAPRNLTEPLPEINDDPAEVARAFSHAKAYSRMAQRDFDTHIVSLLRSAAQELADHRGQLLQALTWETHKPVAVADQEISAAIDAFRHAAEYVATGSITAEENASVTVVQPHWSIPLASAAGQIAEALTQHSAVILTPDPKAPSTAYVLTQLLHSAGIPEQAVQVLYSSDPVVLSRIYSHPDVSRFSVAGTPRQISSIRKLNPHVPTQAFSGRPSAAIVTPSADMSQAVEHIIHSAFDFAGQELSAVGLVIVAGPDTFIKEFTQTLAEAISSSVQSKGADFSTTVPALIQAPSADHLDYLHTAPGGNSQWILPPRQLTEDSTHWSPGLFTSTQMPDSYVSTVLPVPLLGIIPAKNFEHALALYNSLGPRLAGGAYTLNSQEQECWLSNAQSLYNTLNGPANHSHVFLTPLHSYRNTTEGTPMNAELNPLEQSFLDTTKSYLPAEDHLWLEEAMHSDALWYNTVVKEANKAASTTEDAENILPHITYAPLDTPVQVRILPGATLRDILRLQAASLITGTPLVFSGTEEAQDLLTRRSGQAISQDDTPWTAYEFRAAMENLGVAVQVHTDDVFAKAIATAEHPQRIRTLGVVPESLFIAAAESQSDLDVDPVHMDARAELPRLLHIGEHLL